MTSSDKMPRATAQPSVPSRSSSISATRRGRSRHTASSSITSKESRPRRDLTDHSFSMTATPISRSPIRSTQNSKRDTRSTSCAPAPRQLCRPTAVQRWAGLTRSVSSWDDLRRDPELWSEEGDCDVHLCARGASRRGPSFRVPLRALKQKSCNAMLAVCYAQIASDGHEGQLKSFDNLSRASQFVDLYIPAPENASRQDSFDWHITTRNFFAFVMGKPLIGRSMGQSFVKLQERLKLFRTRVDNQQDFIQYIEEQGYRDLVECTDYALASLYYAECYKLRPMWIDAFAHCVGMSDSLLLSPEFTPISKLTRALITRAYLEIDIHLGNVSKALRLFLQDDFSPAFLGLTEGARSHMDRFRRFLHSFYTDKFGYWPPPESAASFPKALYKSMFYDFKNLYEYLADTTSTTDINVQRPAIGGFCVLQNLDNFDKRHKFTPQSHPLPLLPDNAYIPNDAASQRLSRSFSSSSQARKTWKSQSKSAALVAAANIVDPAVVNCKIVQAYMKLEKTYASSSNHKDDKLSPNDARKVRWMLVYGTLQYLSSVLRAPKEVRDVDAADYPLCCLVAPKSSWGGSSTITTPASMVSPTSPRMIGDYFGDVPGSPLVALIEPDCQREDYFTSRAASRAESTENPAPMKISLPSRHSFGPLTSLSGRSSRRNSLKLKPSPHCPILIHGYGDGLNTAKTQAAISSTEQGNGTTENSAAEVPWLNPRAISTVNEKARPISSTCGHSRQRTPLLQSTQFDIVAQSTFLDDASDIMSRSDSTSSMASSVWTDGASAASSKSSANGFYKASAAEYSGLLGGLVSMCGSPVRFETPLIPAPGTTPTLSDVHPLLRNSPTSQGNFQFGFNDEPAAESIPTPTLEVYDGATSPSPAPSTLVPHQVEVRPSTAITVPSSKTQEPNLASKSPTRQTSSASLLTRISRFEIQPASSPTVTKTSHATSKMPSLINRILHDDTKEKDRKKDKRLSFWRR